MPNKENKTENKTGVAYIRVSKKREHMLTIETQKDKIKKFCELHDIELINIYQDIDFSGKTAKRPDFQKMLTDIKNGIINSDYVLVYKLDRFSRSVKEFYKYMSQLEQNNVDLVSITQHFDTSTPIGRAMMGILIQFAQLESELTGQRIKDNLANNAENGRWNGGNVPYGYIWDEDNKILIPDSSQSEIIKMIFQKYISGTSAYTLSQELNNSKYKSPAGYDEWDQTSIVYILKNPIYAGKIKYNKNVYEGKHKAIIDELTFKKANNLIQKYSNSKNSGTTHLLSLLTECAVCGSGGHVKINGPSGYKKKRYLCGNRNKNTKAACDTPYLDGPSLERKVVNIVFHLANSKEYFQILKAELNENARNKSNFLKSREKELSNQIEKIDKALNKLYEDHYIKEIIPQAQFKNFSAKYEKKKEALVNELEMVEVSIQNDEQRDENINILQENIQELKSSWEYLTPEEKNMFLKEIIKKIIFDKNSVFMDLYYTKIKIPIQREFRGVLYF